ncbi:MAG: BON domain-containing protein [Acidobacteriota bacterium]
MNYRIQSKRMWQAGAVLLMLAVVTISACRSKQRTDQQIATDVQAKIQGESALAGQNIQVSAQNGVVTLNGSVSDDASRALAANDSGSVSGVKTVVNNLTVQPAQQAVAQEPAQAQSAPVQRSDRSAESRDRTKRQDRRSAQPIQAPPQQVAQNPPAVPPPTATPAPPPPAPKPTTRTVTLPAGTMLPVRVTETLDSGKAQPNDAFNGTLASDIGTRGMIAMPRGTAVQGRIVEVHEAAHFKGQALLTVELTDVQPHGQRVSVQTDVFSKQGAARGKNTAAKAGGGALLGALIGGLAGGGKGAAIGAAAGGAAGTGVNAITRGQQAVIKSEDVVNFQLTAPITLTVPLNGAQGSGSESDPALQQRQP